MLYLIIGIAVALNIVLVIWKLRNDRVADGIVDGILLVAVAWLFSGSEALLIIGTIGSAITSLYLLAAPVKVGKY